MRSRDAAIAEAYYEGRILDASRAAAVSQLNCLVEAWADDIAALQSLVRHAGLTPFECERLTIIQGMLETATETIRLMTGGVK